jgi:ferritin-like metal-binding protein YciE
MPRVLQLNRLGKELPIMAETLHAAVVDELRDAYDAERQRTKALPKMAKAATSPELRQAFELRYR